jgi:hypothetical protein
VTLGPSQLNVRLKHARLYQREAKTHPISQMNIARTKGRIGKTG